MLANMIAFLSRPDGAPAYPGGSSGSTGQDGTPNGSSVFGALLADGTDTGGPERPQAKATPGKPLAEGDRPSTDPGPDVPSPPDALAAEPGQDDAHPPGAEILFASDFTGGAAAHPLGLEGQAPQPGAGGLSPAASGDAADPAVTAPAPSVQSQAGAPQTEGQRLAEARMSQTVPQGSRAASADPIQVQPKGQTPAAAGRAILNTSLPGAAGQGPGHPSAAPTAEGQPSGEQQAAPFGLQRDGGAASASLQQTDVDAAGTAPGLRLANAPSGQTASLTPEGASGQSVQAQNAAPVASASTLAANPSRLPAEAPRGAAATDDPALASAAPHRTQADRQPAATGTPSNPGAAASQPPVTPPLAQTADIRVSRSPQAGSDGPQAGGAVSPAAAGTSQAADSLVRPLLGSAQAVSPAAEGDAVFLPLQGDGRTPFSDAGVDAALTDPVDLAPGGSLSRAAELPAGAQKPANAVPWSEAAQTIGQRIAQAAAQGGTRFEIQLSPQELGRVQISLDFRADGQLEATLRAETPETVDLLRNDARTLERALTDAGLKPGQVSLNFAQQDSQAGQRDFAGQEGQGGEGRGQDQNGQPGAGDGPSGSGYGPGRDALDHHTPITDLGGGLRILERVHINVTA